MYRGRKGGCDLKVKQLIYFSWDEEGKKKGYHVYKKSRGIDERDVNAIVANLTYAPPKEITAHIVEKLAETSRLLGYPKKGDSGLHFAVQREIDETFPSDKAFFMLPSGECCVARVTYCGVDYRRSVWGNHIIHAYIFPYDPDIVPASLLLSMDFKTRILPSELSPCKTQKLILPMVIDSPVSNLASVGALVKRKKAISVLKRLLDCIFASLHENSDICINADEDTLIFWMYVCQSVLPPEISMLFPFSTCRFSENDGTVFKVRHIIKKFGNNYSYKLSQSDTEHITVVPKNKIFSDRAPELQLSGLITLLLVTAPAESKVLRDLIGTYIKTYGVVDSQDICLIYRLARTDIYDGISELEICHALDSSVFLSFGSETVDRTVEKYLAYASSDTLKIKLYGHLAKYHSTPEHIMDVMFSALVSEVDRERIPVHEALDILANEKFGKSVFWRVVTTLESRRESFGEMMRSRVTRNFAFKLLFSGYCDLGVSEASDLLISLIPDALDADKAAEGEIPVCIDELISVVEYDESVYKRVIYGYYDRCCETLSDLSSWCALVTLLFEQGRKLSSEASICAFIMRELDNGALLEYMKRGNDETKCVISVLSSLHRFGAISDRAYLMFVYGKFKDFLSLTHDEELIRFVIDALKSDNEKLVDALSSYMSAIDKNSLLAICKSTLGEEKINDPHLLDLLHESPAKYIGVSIINESITSSEKFIEYLKLRYASGYYKSCFSKALKKHVSAASDEDAWKILCESLTICKAKFSTTQRVDFELWMSLLENRIISYVGRENALLKLLLEAKAVTDHNGSSLPCACETMLETGLALSKKGDILPETARSFTENASSELKDIYVRTYGIRLVSLSVSDSDEDTISSAIWLALVSSDDENLTKLVRHVSKLSSSSVRIILGRMIDAGIIEKYPTRFFDTVCTLAGNMKPADYISFKKRVIARYGKKKYSDLFINIEEGFSIIARRKLAAME